MDLMKRSFHLAWGSITGRECHDAGGRDSIGNLFITLESALLQSKKTRIPADGMDFVVICVPADKRWIMEKFLEDRFGGESTDKGRILL